MDANGRDRMIDASSDSKTLRPRFGRVLVVLAGVVVIAVLVSLAITGIGPLVRFGPLALLGAYVVWLLFWSPAVTIAPSGVIVRNLLREHEVTWPAIERIDTKYALQLYTTAGTVTAWSAPAPGRHATFRVAQPELGGLPESTYAAERSVRPGDIPTSESGLAALYVRRFWEQLRDAGHLDSGVIEGTGVRTHLLRRETIVLVVLIAVAVLAAALLP
ncbi:PH domain-containing protein [Microbacterium sp.]|uniref:PH domain-containing protein n=1 Tax=Microbacterium sp. TaxID=51671 RepID=UPI001AD57BFC|nr:PH domain-containing protein [Microbacterium sp.]MBN9180909.1 PH domain-containing protein [Microbacterium sp.]MBN9191718.1 PH domain-containing protein [Microbacterium sp.]